jgi:hypothetical protein
MTNLDAFVLLVLLALAVGVAFLVLALRGRQAEGPDVRGAVEAQSVRIDRLADVLGRRVDDDRVLQGDLGRTREAVEALRSAVDARVHAEESAWTTIGRLGAVLLGGGPRGRPGENLLGEALAQLPGAMLARDFAVNGKRVEFALVLPDNKRLPVDSKWTAVRDLEALDAEEDPQRREVLCRKVEDEVARRAREARAYLEPSLTTPFAVVCVPDAAFAACRKAHADAFAHGVVLVPYSTAVPVLLALYSLALRYGDAGDVQACLADVEAVLGSMEQTLENKLARAAAMLRGAVEDWRSQLGRARGAVARVRGAPGEEPADEEATTDDVEAMLRAG